VENEQNARRSARQDCHTPQKTTQKARVPGGSPLAFTLAPHLQTINHRGRFPPIVGI
jgi:hypothetical protein